MWKGLIPGLESAPESAYTKAWMNMRRELKLPDTMQLYSLKDTGITNMLENGVPAIDVMKQAGHHDLSMTTQYANHKDIRIAQKCITITSHSELKKKRNNKNIF